MRISRTYSLQECLPWSIKSISNRRLINHLIILSSILKFGVTDSQSHQGFYTNISLLSKTQGNDRKLNWNKATTTAITAIKGALAASMLLTHPKPLAPTCIMTDVSDTAVGAVLQQQVAGEWHPISYFSKKLGPADSLQHI